MRPKILVDLQVRFLTGLFVQSRVWAGNGHACSLKSSIGKARDVAAPIPVL
jgi:hypothetical protein